jgi:ABC-type multidrug transport system fused ATPase/permease subunit
MAGASRAPRRRFLHRSEIRLLRYLRPHWRGAVGVLVTVGIMSAIEVARPWPLKVVVDQVLSDKPLPGFLRSAVDPLSGRLTPQALLVWAAAGTVLIFLAGTLTSMVSTVVTTRLAQRTTFDVGADLFAHLQRQSLVFHNRRPVGDSIARVTGDSYSVATIVTGAIVPVLQSLITLLAMFAVMWALEPRLTLLALAVVPLQVASIRVFGGQMKARTRRRRDLEGELMTVVQQTLTAVPAVQAFTREEREDARYRNYANETVKAYVQATMAGNWFKLFAGLSTAFGTAGILYLGGRLAIEGKVSVGTILVFLAYLAALYVPLNSITYTAQTWQTAAAQADRVMEMLDAPADVRDRPGARNLQIRHGEVRFEDVTFGYEAGRPVVKNVSIEASPGETVAIVGPTGAGKTTLMNLLIRFFDPWSGRVTIDGHDIAKQRLRSLRDQIALVLQEPFIFPIAVAENIGFGRADASAARIAAAARAANAHQFIERLPQSYDTQVGERGATLSAGEKQRLSIARAFLKDAPILILDEPTSALDARTESLLLEALERLTEQRTTFVVAHRLSTIRNADRIVVLDDARVLEQGSHDELLGLDGVYAGLYRTQMDLARHEGSETAMRGRG